MKLEWPKDLKAPNTLIPIPLDFSVTSHTHNMTLNDHSMPYSALDPIWSIQYSFSTQDNQHWMASMGQYKTVTVAT